MASLTNKIFAALKAGGDAALTAPPPPPQQHQQQSASASGASATLPTSSGATATWHERFCHVAVQGCCHGELDRIYDACAEHERQTGKRIDLLICCGDFQAIRNPRELDSMAVPDKYKVMGDFHKYCTPVSTGGGGAETRSTTAAAAPYLTIFIGGNHENSDLLAQESYGGFVAPNIYYLGHSGVVTVDNCLRIAGLSGIFKEQDYDRPYPPRPYAANQMWKKGAYHVRRVEVAKLRSYLRAAQQIEQCTVEASTAEKATKKPLPLVDVFVSHDWPVGITSYGDEAHLLRYKPYFRDDIRNHALGNPHTMQLLREAKPLYWVAAHLHCFFEATVSHTFARTNADDGSDSAAPTSFVALDKCAKGSGFLSFLDLPRHHRGSSAAPAAGNDGEKDSGKARNAADSAQRIRREPLWLEVLTASHACVAANRTTDTPRHARNGEGCARQQQQQHDFSIEETVHDLVERHTSSDVMAPSDAALYAPSTAALLEALRLSPALPLQQPVALDTAVRTSSSYSNERGNRGQWDGSPHMHNASGVARQHQRPRMESAAVNNTVTQQPWYTEEAQRPCAAQPVASPPAPLSFFEDVGTASAEQAKGEGAPPAPSLGWFEDTAQ